MSDNDKAKFDKVIDKLKSQMNASDDQVEKLKEMAKKYDDKSSDDIFIEIIKFRDQMKESMDDKEFEKKIKKLEKIRPFLNEEQIKKLDKLLEVLKDS